LSRDRLDIAIRVRFPPLAPSDLVMRQLDQSIQCLVASPGLVPRALMSPADLVGLPSLDLGPVHREHVWQLHHEDGRTAAVRHAPRLVTDDMPALRDAAYAGVGVVQLPMMMIWEGSRRREACRSVAGLASAGGHRPRDVRFAARAVAVGAGVIGFSRPRMRGATNPGGSVAWMWRSADGRCVNGAEALDDTAERGGDQANRVKESSRDEAGEEIVIPSRDLSANPQ
jgi:hypothetical protein